MYLLLRTKRIRKEKPWVTFVLRFIIVHGFFTVMNEENIFAGIKKLTSALPESILAEFKNKLMTALGHLKCTGLENNSSWAYEVFEMFKSFEKSKDFQLSEPQDNAVKSAIAVGFKKVEEIRKMVQFHL